MNFVSFFRRLLKKYFPWLYNNSSFLRNFIYRSLFTKTTSINIIKEFQEFAPNVSGEEHMKIENTIYNIQNFQNQCLNSKASPKHLRCLSKYQRKLGKIFDNMALTKKHMDMT